MVESTKPSYVKPTAPKAEIKPKQDPNKVWTIKEQLDLQKQIDKASKK